MSLENLGTRACSTSPIRLGQRHVFRCALYGLLGVLLSACGGGSDEGSTAKQAVAVATAESAQSATPPAHKRRARAYDREGVTAIAVSPDGNAVGVANSDGRVRVLDATGESEIRMLKTAGGAVSAGLVFSTDGRYLVTVGRDSVAQVWSVETGERRFTLRGHEHGLRAVAASPDGSVIATGGEGTRVMLWNGRTGRLERVFSGHTDFVNALSVSADGRVLASGDASARILVWDIATGRLLHTLRGHAGEVNAVAFSADSRLLASGGEDGKVLLWDTANGRQVHSLGGQRSAVRSLAFNGDGGLLAAGAEDGKVVVWNMATRTVMQEVAGSTAAVNAVAFDGHRNDKLFVGSEENRVRPMQLERGGAR